MEFRGKRDYAAIAQDTTTKPSSQSLSATPTIRPLQVPKSGDVKKSKVEVNVKMGEEKTENKTDRLTAFMMAQTKWLTGERVQVLTRSGLTTPSLKVFRRDCLALSNRHILVTAPQANGSNIYVFSAVNGLYTHKLKGLPGFPVALLLSNNGKVAVSYSRTVACAWNVETGALLHSFAHPHMVCAMALHGAMLAVAFHGGVYLWNLASGQRVHQFVGLDATSGVASYALVLDDQHIAVYDNHALQLYDAKLGGVLFTWTPKTISGNKILLDSATHSLVALDCRAIHIWNTETGAHRRMTPGRGDDAYQGMAMQAGKLVVYSIGASHSILVIDMKGSATVLYTIMGPKVVGNSKAELCKLARPRTNKLSIPTEHVLTVVSNELIVVTANDQHFIHLVDVKNRKFVRNIAGDGDREGEGEGHIVAIYASIGRLQVVRKGPGSQLTYVRHDFSGQTRL